MPGNQRPVLCPPPGPNGISGSSGPHGQTPKDDFLVSSLPQYIHRPRDSEAAKNQEYTPHTLGRQPQSKLTRSSKSLWKYPTGWDIRIVSQDGTWLAHEELLKREAPDFFDIVRKMATTDGTKKDGKDVITIDLSAWKPSIAGALLKFLYVGDWEDMDGHPPGPTNLRSVEFHVHMAAQAWSLNFPTSVREEAVAKINRATYQLNNSITTVLTNHPFTRAGYYSVEMHLYQSLDFLYKQENPEVMKYLMPIRAAISRLVDVALPWLFKQPDFKPRFQTIWSKEPVYGRFMGDHHKFYHLRCLLPSWDDPPESVEPEAGSSSGEDTVHEKATEKR